MGRRGGNAPLNSADTLVSSNDDLQKMENDANLVASNGIDSNSSTGDKAKKRDKKRKKKSKNSGVVEPDESVSQVPYNPPSIHTFICFTLTGAHIVFLYLLIFLL